MNKIPMQVPFGAVYFRKTNPPKQDWERDYRIAAEDGLNVFRHWFMWSAIERRPGEYDWEDYDRQLDLAAENGIKTIIAELTHTVPDWAYRKFAHARQITSDGRPLGAIMGVSAATGGFAHNGGGAGSLTLNCDEVKDAAGRFLTALAARYRGHPGLLGYDIWNECNYSPKVDYSTYTKAAYRSWLKAKYGDLDTLATSWYRYSYAEWDDVEPPAETAPYPEGLDWLTFKRENFYDQMQFKIDTVRAVDKDCLIVSHGVGGAIPDMAARGSDDWLAASKVEAYGFTWIQARKGDQQWRSFYAADLNRAAARGKQFWHAERQGGPLWMQPQVVGRDKEDGRKPEPEDIRVWTLTSFAAGARGVLNLRYRPLLDGPLFGAFGSYGMDGSRTPRSDMASALAKWANAPEQADLMAAAAVQGDIGLLVVPETQQWDYLLSHEGKYDTYAAAMWGAYQGFFDNGLQPDWVHLEDIEAYDALYFPYPIMLTAQSARRIADWVEQGGTLIAEACPGYFGDRGKVGVVQPNNGLDRVFGAIETDVEFMPDIGDRIRFAYGDLNLVGGGFLQAYDAAGGTVRGQFDDGRNAVIEHGFGKGRTLLVGTHPSVGYYRDQSAAGRGYFAECFAFTGKTPATRSNNDKVQIRLHTNGQKRFVWIVNATRQAQTGSLEIAGAPLSGAGTLKLGNAGAGWDGASFTVPPRDVVIIEI